MGLLPDHGDGETALEPPRAKRWKGKGRAGAWSWNWNGKRDDLAAGELVNLTLVGDGIYTACVCDPCLLSSVRCWTWQRAVADAPRSVYTIPVAVGNNSQQFALQVDTGSSDLVSSASHVRSRIMMR